MKVTQDQIFTDDNDSSGFDVRVNVAALGCTTNDPPGQVSIELPSGEVVEFDLCAEAVGSCDQFLYWSYWNEGMEAPAINLQVFAG